jgi:N6-L-threonylcarbamoyladenine synthase
MISVKILGIESSCDETAASVVEDGTRVISNVVHTQIDLHKVYGGVVPEVAARSHIEMILPVIDKAVTDAYLSEHPEVNPDGDIKQQAWDAIDAIACTTMPGLIGSLLIGSLTARTLALVKDKPFYPIHHVEAHVYANFLTEKMTRKTMLEPNFATKTIVTTIEITTEDIRESQPKFPMLALIVSGGHTQLVFFRGHGDYDLIGQTQDDAVGEAFDKVAKILGLPYPGGPSIAHAAEHSDPKKYHFPKAKLQGKYDFSFSGLKTAVLRAVQSEVGKDHTYPSNDLKELLSASQRNDFAASFQYVAIETLVDKTVAAYHEFSPTSVVIAGGVAASQELRRQLSERLPIPIEYPPMEYCTDNAAMVASLGYFMAQGTSPIDPRTVEVHPSISMAKTAWNNP